MKRLIAFALFLPMLAHASGPAEDRFDHFNDRVLPLLQARCISCHGPDKQKGGLRLDSLAAVLKGGETGPAAVTGKPDESLLVQAVRQTHGDLKMPPKEKLAADEVETLAQWVRHGLPWSAQVRTLPEPGSTRLGNAWSDPRNPIVRIFQGKRLDLWSLKPLAPAKASSIDELVQASLQKVDLRLSPEADRRTLIRRVTFDLTGLPPTLEELEERDYSRVVDRLLASPRYGERWARHWMDVVRYSDTQGFERDEFQTLIWRYRDYLIRSFNTDKPFDQFILEQLSGDEMVSGAPATAAEVDRLIATGYLRLGPVDSTGSLFEENAKNRNELMTDLANTTGSAFLGLTLSCANCHDHKYDPISQADHFRIRAFFAGVKRQDDTAIDLAPVQEEIQKHNADIDANLAELAKTESGLLKPARQTILSVRREGIPADILPLLDIPKEKQTKEIKEKLKPYAEKLRIEDKDLVKALSPSDRDLLESTRREIARLRGMRRESIKAMTMREEGGARPKTHLFYQGDFTQPREEVTAGFLSALDPNPATDARRSTLAAWIASPGNPLTARVIVNRVWQSHFGRGIVATPNDFGFSGSRPSHLELLDWLASEFIKSGWSLKSLHRRILLSSTYRQASKETPEGKRVDPDNLLLWRQNVRRLDAEATRDALLAVSGTLLGKDSGAPVWPPVPQDILDAQPGILETKSDQSAKDRLQGWFTDALDKTDVRSVFLIQKRALGVPFLSPFDVPDMNVSCGRRDCTTVAPQALQLLNSPFAERMAVAFSKRVESDAGGEERVLKAFRLALGRRPTEAEFRLGQSVVRRRGSLVDWCRVLLNLNEFVYLD